MLAACWLVARKLSRVRTLRQRQSASREGLLACAVPGFSAPLQYGRQSPGAEGCTNQRRLLDCAIATAVS